MFSADSIPPNPPYSDEAKKLHETHATETGELLNQLAAQGMQRATMDDFMIASERDAECDRLDRIRKELEDEREKFTHAAVKLGKEKSTFEVKLDDFLSLTLSLIFVFRVKGSSFWKTGDHGRSNNCFPSALPPLLRKHYPPVWLLTFLT